MVGDHRLIPPPFAILKGSAQKHSSKPLGGSFPNGTSGKEPSASAEDIKDLGLTPGSERSPGGGYGNPLQYPCLENPMDRGVWEVSIYKTLMLGMIEGRRRRGSVEDEMVG